MEEYKYDLRIPKERVAVLIGTKGEIKKRIEKETSTKLDIDSEEGDVAISGDDSVKLFTAREIVTAIGRGFNPKIALKLLKFEYVFELININDSAKSKQDLQRLKGRIIGQEGKSRKVIESLTDCEICVYGKTVGIIGPAEEIDNARKAIEMLINGSKHGNVFSFLEKQKKEKKIEDFKGKV